MPDPEAADREVLAFFERQRSELMEKTLKANPAASRKKFRITVGGKKTKTPTFHRMTPIVKNLRDIAGALRSVNPRRIINAVAMHHRIEPLTIARHWPEIARQLREENG